MTYSYSPLYFSLYTKSNIKLKSYLIVKYDIKHNLNQDNIFHRKHYLRYSYIHSLVFLLIFLLLLTNLNLGTTMVPATKT